MKRFETERLILTSTTTEDATLQLAVMNSEDWINYIGDRNVHDVEAAKKYIEQRTLPQFLRLGFGNYTLSLKSTGEKIGFCGLYDRDGLEGLDIGFALLPQFYKKGYSFEACQPLLAFAFNEKNYSKVSAITVPENKASIALIEKLGFSYIKDIELEGDDATLRLYELTKENYAA